MTRVLLGVVVLAAALSAGQLALPGSACACSCLAPPNGAAPFDGSEDAVLIGRVGAEAQGGRFVFEVERWFKGGASATVQLQSGMTPSGGGAVTIDTCGLMLVTGSHLILAASLGDGALVPGSCSPNASVESAEGQALLAAALRTFGPGIAIGQPPPTESGDLLTIDLGLIAIGATLAVLVLIAVLVVLAFGRREPPATPTP